MESTNRVKAFMLMMTGSETPGIRWLAKSVRGSKAKLNALALVGKRARVLPVEAKAHFIVKLLKLEGRKQIPVQRTPSVCLTNLRRSNANLHCYLK